MHHAILYGMKETTLLKTALCCAIVGLVVLYYFSEQIVVEERVIEKITSMDIDRDVKIKGVVERVSDMDKIAILEISQPKTIRVVMFKNGDVDVNEGDYVYVTGSVDEFEGKMEIIADEIRED